MWKPISALFGLGLLLSVSHVTEAIECYQGNHTTVSGGFPDANSTNTCDTGSGDTCMQLRRKEWDLNPGYFELYFGCGDCSKAQKTGAECRECKTDRCNVEFGMELVDSLDKDKNLLCYNQLKTKKGDLPIPVFCPKFENCTSSKSPSDGRFVLTGCQSHCNSLKWQGCTFCGSDLCNLQRAKGASSSGSSNQAAAPLVLPTLPPPPARSALPSENLKTVKTEGTTAGKGGQPVSDTASAASKTPKVAPSTAAGEACRPTVLAAVFAASAVLVAARPWK